MPATERITIALLHEHALARASLEQCIRQQAPQQLLCSVADGPALKRAFAVGPAPSAVLLSWAHKDLVEWVSEHAPETSLLVLGTSQPDTELAELFRRGAHGFCCERYGPVELMAVLEHVQRGGLHFPRTVLARIRTLMPKPTEAHVSQPLSPGQAQFLRLLAELDKPTYALIAARMETSLSMVYKHRDNVCRHHGLQGKSALMRFAVQHALGR